MSYIQIPIGPLKKDDNQLDIADSNIRPLKFNNYACMLIQRMVDPSHIVESSNYAVVYAGLKANNYVKGIADDFTFEQVCDWVDELPENVVLEVYKVFMDTQGYKNMQAKANVVTDEKKSTSQEPSTTATASELVADT